MTIIEQIKKQTKGKKSFTVKIHDITLAQYLASERRNDYDFCLRNGLFDPLDLFEIGDFQLQSFGFVKDLQYIYNNEGLSIKSYIDFLTESTSITLKEIGKKSLLKFYQSMMYAKEQIDIINTLESKFLGHNPSNDEIRAGVEDFAKYGSFIQFDLLTGGDLIKTAKYRILPYNECFKKLLYEADKTKFEQRLIEIRNRKLRN